MRALLAATAVLLLANAVALALTDAPMQGLRVRGLHHVYQAGRHLGVALLAAAVLVLCRRLRLLERRRGYLVLAAFALLVGAETLTEDLANFAGTVLPAAPQLALWALVVVVAGGVVAAAAVGRWLARPRLRWLAVAGGAAVLFVHPFVLETGYPGAHLFLAAAAVALIAGALVTAALPRVWSQLVAALPWALGAGLAAFTFVVPPSNSLQLQMLQQEGDVITPFVSRLGGGIADIGEGAVPKAWEPWFVRRDDAPPIPASQPPLLTKPPIVLLITVDSLRANIIDSKKYDKNLPNLAALRDASLHFTEARAPGSQTVYTISEFFMGKYFSQQYWSTHPVHRDLWPDDDETPRFPQVLTDAGIPTLNLATTVWLIGDAGVVRGFSEDMHVAPVKSRYTLSAQTLPVLIDRLEKVGDGPLFAYTHMLDAHYTVSPLGKKLPATKRYLANLKLVDDSIGELRAAIDRLGLADRTYLIVSSDHGEAFGEHNTHHHRYTVYEELLRVPLLIHGPGVAPRAVPAQVTVMDVGPTILDIFGQATPGDNIG